MKSHSITFPTENSWTLLYFDAVYLCQRTYFTHEPVVNLLSCDYSNESYWAVLSRSFAYYAAQGGSNLDSVDEILECDHPSESYWAVLFRGAIYFPVHAMLKFHKSYQIHRVGPYRCTIPCSCIWYSAEINCLIIGLACDSLNFESCWLRR